MIARILAVDDDDGVRSFVAESLAAHGHEVDQAATGTAALACLRKRTYDLLLTDLRMPGMDGLALLETALAEQPELQAIVVTAHGDVESAVAAMKLGAFDYLEKPVSGPEELRLLCARALERRELLDHRARAHVTGTPRLGYGDPAMQRVVEQLGKVAPTHASVLLLGESGTGKEVAARWIHDHSARREGPFVAINCAALAESLIESELFGHEKGAFTGAGDRKRGRLELAQGGTVFLDEIAELAASTQAKLLRVLQERCFERVGGVRSIEIDVRWIAATNRDLQTHMTEGRFREDLYHRLAVFPVRLPPLRERPSDLGPLATALLERLARELGRPGLALSERALDRLRAWRWPGNVRELANTLERAAILAGGATIEAEHLLLDPPDLCAPSAFESCRLEDLEREAILRAVEDRGQPASRSGAARHRTAYPLRKAQAVRRCGHG